MVDGKYGEVSGHPQAIVRTKNQWLGTSVCGSRSNGGYNELGWFDTGRRTTKRRLSLCKGVRIRWRTPWSSAI